QVEVFARANDLVARDGVANANRASIGNRELLSSPYAAWAKSHGVRDARPVERFLTRDAQQLPAAGYVPNFHLAGQDQTARVDAAGERSKPLAVRAEGQPSHRRRVCS